VVAATPEFRELAYFEQIVAEFGASSVEDRITVEDAGTAAVAPPDWSTLSTEERLAELQTRLQAILGRELRMSPSSISLDAPFPELGLDSMMAMTVLKETKKLVGLDVSANMLFNHPTIASLATYVAGLLAPADVPEEDSGDSAAEPERSVLDDLFESVESASASTDGGLL
jgi:phthiocerol/phenolphthiocerol synthesis type-I polyketide synthase D